jgi:CBS domain containing-hemolysin-like protein
VPVALVIVVVLIFLNGLFVASEFAIVATPRTSLARRAEKGERIAARLVRIMSRAADQDRFVATAQLGITLSSLGLGMYGEQVVAEGLTHQLEGLGDLERFVAAHTLASVIAISTLTFFHIVVGEMVPKTLALQYPEPTAIVIARPMIVARVVLYPLVVVLYAAGSWVLRRMGIDRRAGGVDRYYTTEELDEVVAESAQRGLIRPESGQVIRELLEFGDITAREVMVPRVRVTGIEVGATPDEIVHLLRESSHTRYPVHSGDLDRVLGAIHIKDLVQVLREGRPIDAADARPIPYVVETAPLDDVLDTMQRDRTQIAVVLDEHGGTAGLVTIEDLFEEIVGEIADGTAPRRPSIYRDRAGVLHVAGTVRVEEAGEAVGRVLEHPEVDSVSGLVLTLLGRVPVVGDEAQYAGVAFKVVATQGNGVRECEVEPLPEGTGDSPGGPPRRAAD